MCGIIGTNFLSNKFDKSLELLNHRGPDFQKSVKIENKQFGHTRLAIIDLNEEANQPMIFDDILLVFNGEIYNYKELKKIITINILKFKILKRNSYHSIAKMKFNKTNDFRK